MSSQLVASIRALIPNCQGIYLFGSYADGSNHQGSDIDVAVLLPEPIDTVERWRLAQQLAQQFLQDVDLVDLQSASTVMQFEITQHGKLLWQDGHADQFENRVMRQFQDLNLERQQIVESQIEQWKRHG